MQSRSQKSPLPQTPEPATWSPDNFPKGWEYIDGQARHAANPLTFAIPAFEEVMDVVVGDLVKVGIENPKSRKQIKAERFWVEIKALDGHRKAPYRFIGIIRNHLTGVLWHGIGFGDIVKFHAKHIIGTSPENKNYHKHTSETSLRN